MRTHAIRSTAFSGKALTSEVVVDCHVHLDYWKPAFRQGADLDSILASMDRVGIDVACMNKCTCPDMQQANTDVGAALRAHPDRFVGFAAVFPAFGKRIVMDELRRCFDEMGFRGIKVNNAYENLPMRDHSELPETKDALETIWEFASEKKCPVLCHGFLTPEIAREHPDAIFIRAHACGNRAFAREYSECSNVVFDTAASGMLRGNIEYMASIVGIERIVYGSDMPYANPAYRLGQVIGTDLDDDPLRQVLGKNMAGILGLNCRVYRSPAQQGNTSRR